MIQNDKRIAPDEARVFARAVKDALDKKGPSRHLIELPSPTVTMDTRPLAAAVDRMTAEMVAAARTNESTAAQLTSMARSITALVQQFTKQIERQQNDRAQVVSVAERVASVLEHVSRQNDLLGKALGMIAEQIAEQSDKVAKALEARPASRTRENRRLLIEHDDGMKTTCRWVDN